MSGHRGLFALIIALLVLALVAFALVTLGRTSNEINRSSLSSEPGGALALYELLDEAGVPVERIYREPWIERYDMGVVVVFVKLLSWEDFSFDDYETHNYEEAFQKADVLIRVYVGSELPARNTASTRSVETHYAAFGRVAEITTEWHNIYEGVSPTGELELLRTSSGTVVATADVFPGRIEINVYGGESFLNRFLGDDDNAEFAYSLIASLLPPGKRVIFPEYVYGISGVDNVFVRLGPSFTSSLIQLLFMFALLVYTLGKRFGYPDVEEPSKPGTANFVAAMAETYKRGKCTDIVMSVALNYAVRRAARKLNIPSELSLEQKIRRVPEELGNQMRKIYTIRNEKLSRSESNRLLKELNRQMKLLNAG